jgi:hypothetical protein
MRMQARLSLVALLALLTACTGSNAYRDPAGWTVEIPDGWHVLSFGSADGDASSTGTQISNIELPPPTIHTGLPIQTSSNDLPVDGVAIVIATDDDPSNVQSPPESPAEPPLFVDDLAVGSSTGGGPSLSLLWFGCGGEPLLISMKQAPSVTATDRASAEDLIRSIRCTGTDG